MKKSETYRMHFSASATRKKKKKEKSLFMFYQGVRKIVIKVSAFIQQMYQRYEQANNISNSNSREPLATFYGSHTHSALRKHAYSNILKILQPKPEIFSDKYVFFFHISAQNIDCGYSLEPPRRGGSNEELQTTRPKDKSAQDNSAHKKVGPRQLSPSRPNFRRQLDPNRPICRRPLGS